MPVYLDCLRALAIVVVNKGYSRFSSNGYIVSNWRIGLSGIVLSRGQIHAGGPKTPKPWQADFFCDLPDPRRHRFEQGTDTDRGTQNPRNHGRQTSSAICQTPGDIVLSRGQIHAGGPKTPETMAGRLLLGSAKIPRLAIKRS